MRGNTKISLRQMLLFVVFLVSPFLSLPIIFTEIYNNKKYAYVFLALFMGLCAVLFPPFADLYRHTQDYFEYARNPEEVLIVTDRGFDLTLYSLSNIFARCGVNFEMVRFIFTVSCYSIVFAIFRDVVKNNSELSRDRKIFFIGFLCVFLSVPFIWIVNGLRYTTASFFVLYGAYLLLFKRANLKGLLWMLLGGLTHFAIFMAIVPIVLYNYFPIVRFSRSVTIILSVVMVALSSSLMVYVMPLFVDDRMTSVAEYYIENTDVFSGARSLMGLIANILERSMLPILILFLMYKKGYRKIKSVQLCYILLIIAAALSGFMILFDRFTLFIIPLFIIVVLSIYNSERWQKMALKFVLLATLISSMAYLYGYREPLVRGRTYQILYKPAPLIMSNTYDQNWVHNNVNKKGEFK